GTQTASGEGDEVDLAPLAQVMILDDTLANTMLLRAYLSDVADVSTVGFTNPLEALQWARTGLPDLVLVDLVMPDLDGFEFLRRFRALSGGVDVPVLVVTALEDEDAKRRALEEGAYDVLRKPVNQAEFVARTRNLLNLRQRQTELKQANQILEEHARDLTALNATLEKEIDSRRQLEEELRRLASFDSLTGLLVRRRFLELANRDLSRTNRTGNQSCLLMLDVDHFKSINDRFGHAAGDDVLRWFADRCREAFRSIDLIGRFGGEEFIVLLPDTALPEARIAAERLRVMVESTPVPDMPSDFVVTVSIGIALVSIGVDTLEQTIIVADEALYSAKKQGRNRIIVASEQGDPPPAEPVPSQTPA
ncbi:MAG: GGDEF domain-containing response regulator, partial [Rhodospirillaceae bacterium]